MQKSVALSPASLEQLSPCAQKTRPLLGQLFLSSVLAFVFDKFLLSLQSLRQVSPTLWSLLCHYHASFLQLSFAGALIAPVNAPSPQHLPSCTFPAAMARSAISWMEEPSSPSNAYRSDIKMKNLDKNPLLMDYHPSFRWEIK